MRVKTIAALLLAVSALASLPSASAAPQGSRWGSDYFPNVPLTTQNGTKVHFYDDLLKGKLVVINFIYTHCNALCPLETARLAQVQKLLGDRVGKDIFFYSITLDPERDKPDVLRDYADKFDVGPGWLFLTGKKKDITLIKEKLGLDSDPSPSSGDGHAPSVLLGNESTGQWMRNTALDNPKFLAIMIGNWLDSWKNSKIVKSYAEAPAMVAPDKGQYLFRTRCADCHTIGKGDTIGPDLADVTTRRDRAWLARWLAVPDQMLAEKDPIATALYAKYKNVIMPNQRLDKADVAAIIGFLETFAAVHKEPEKLVQ